MNKVGNYVPKMQKKKKILKIMSWCCIKVEVLGNI